jgi:hypothetical protein
VDASLRRAAEPQAVAIVVSYYLRTEAVDGAGASTPMCTDGIRT